MTGNNTKNPNVQPTFLHFSHVMYGSNNGVNRYRRVACVVFFFFSSSSPRSVRGHTCRTWAVYIRPAVPLFDTRRRRVCVYTRRRRVYTHKNAFLLMSRSHPTETTPDVPRRPVFARNRAGETSGDGVWPRQTHRRRKTRKEEKKQSKDPFSVHRHGVRGGSVPGCKKT